MGKLTLADLKKLREEKRKEISRRDAEGKTIQIIIGMGTCGIAAGAKVTFDSFLDEIEHKEVVGVNITQTGCMGLCYAEPTVEVQVPGMPSIIYGNVSGEVAKRIVNDHLINQKLVSDHIFDKPAADLLK